MDYYNKKSYQRNIMKKKREEKDKIKEWAETHADDIIQARREKAKPKIDIKEIPF